MPDLPTAEGRDHDERTASLTLSPSSDLSQNLRRSPDPNSLYSLQDEKVAITGNQGIDSRRERAGEHRRVLGIPKKSRSARDRVSIRGAWHEFESQQETLEPFDCFSERGVVCKALPHHVEHFLDGILRDDEGDSSCDAFGEQLTFIPSEKKSREDRVRIKRDSRTVHSRGES